MNKNKSILDSHCRPSDEIGRGVYTAVKRLADSGRQRYLQLKPLQHSMGCLGSRQLQAENEQAARLVRLLFLTMHLPFLPPSEQLVIALAALLLPFYSNVGWWHLALSNLRNSVGIWRHISMICTATHRGRDDERKCFDLTRPSTAHVAESSAPVPFEQTRSA